MTRYEHKERLRKQRDRERLEREQATDNLQGALLLSLMLVVVAALIL